MRTAGEIISNYWNDYEFLEDKVNFRELRLLSEEQFKIAKKIIIEKMEFKTWGLNLFRFAVTDINLKYNWIEWRVSDERQRRNEIQDKYLSIFEDVFTVDVLNSIIEYAVDIVVKHNYRD